MPVLPTQGLRVNCNQRRQTYARIGVKEPQLEGHIVGGRTAAAREQYRVTQAQDTRGWSATRCVYSFPLIRSSHLSSNI